MKRTLSSLTDKLETLAREYVDRWIEDGSATYEMQDRALYVCAKFSEFITRDIRKFAETGKYPQYVPD